MHDDIVLIGIGQHEDTDRRHAARETQRVFGAVPNGKAILENFLIGCVEARIYQTVRTAWALAGDAFEMAFPIGRAWESEGRRQEDRRFEATFRQHRVEAVTHHQSAGLEFAAADLGHFRLGRHAGRGGVDIVIAH